jgi:hypothetical protein
MFQNIKVSKFLFFGELFEDVNFHLLILFFVFHLKYLCPTSFDIISGNETFHSTCSQKDFS